MNKVVSYFFILGLFVSICSCTKDDPPAVVKLPAGKDSLLMLSIKWKIIEDSVSSINYTFPWGGIPIPGAYYGTSDDHYTFDTSYRVSAHENGHDYINGTYKLLPKSQISIDVTEPQYIGDIKTLNNVNAIFEWVFSSSNGGKYFRRLTLAK
ncbi:MAG: hypothetical protein ABIN94_03220 [Ferruginibacter sp.]